MNPKPIVMMFRASLSTTALQNIKNKPAHMNRTRSRFGKLLLSPVIKAISAGMVAQCITIAANHPKVSADIL